MSHTAFEAVYEVYDGYAGGSRPQSFNISIHDVEADQSDEELREFYHSSVQEHFEQSISPAAQNEQQFVEWVRASKSGSDKS